MKNQNKTRQQRVDEMRAMLPGQLDLCKIAATLAAGKTFNRIEADQFAKQAIDLWYACAQNLMQLPSQQADNHIQGERRIAEMPRFPCPTKYPASLNDFLRSVIGGKYIHNRVATYRRFLKDCADSGEPLYLGPTFKIKITPKAVESGSIIAAHKKHSFTEMDFLVFGTQLGKWLQNDRAKQAHEKAVNAARARHGE